MTFWQMVLVLVAGIGAGTINTIVGSGTLITFPSLLAVGISPLTANVSNTVGLFPGSFVGAYGYRRELSGQRDRVIRLVPASVLGAVVGAVLLLVLPSSAFDAIVPVLIAIGLLLVMFGKQINARLSHTSVRPRTDVTPLLWVLTFFTGIYGGYFGAAQGVLLMGVFGVLVATGVQEHNALKNVLAGLVNFVAAILFICTAHIDWTAAGLIAVGSIIGGLIGARVGRRLSPNLLRGVIVVVGVIAIVKLLV